ncbi:hypothetical protein HPB52_016438 [Rhipicephalus sanguineus]|uniref:GH18 domain-containing protein n=1 Tax=Rhipicephalus sanguineus TaxID=34632 RepID=A0A9D4T165_RHISA|nr:hypothetical protein HPB52_016438 [Rhipicephalus sanguineus]
MTSRSIFTLPVHTSTRSAATVVPASCIHSPRKVSDQNPLLATAPSLFTASPKALVFCLYNNSRYTIAVPILQQHSVLVLGVDDGTVQSRAPQFDLAHGIGVLRQNIINRGIGNATILVALGGYSEDGPQFSRLGADESAMSRFASSVLYLLQTYHLDGVALHWIGPEQGCRGADDASTLVRVLRTVRQSVLASGYNGLVTLILPAEDVQSRLSSATVQTVDYIFLETHLELPSLLYSLSHCRNFAAIVKSALEAVPGTFNSLHHFHSAMERTPHLATPLVAAPGC